MRKSFVIVCLLMLACSTSGKTGPFTLKDLRPLLPQLPAGTVAQAIERETQVRFSGEMAGLGSVAEKIATPGVRGPDARWSRKADALTLHWRLREGVSQRFFTPNYHPAKAGKAFYARILLFAEESGANAALAQMRINEQGVASISRQPPKDLKGFTPGAFRQHQVRGHLLRCVWRYENLIFDFRGSGPDARITETLSIARDLLARAQTQLTKHG